MSGYATCHEDRCTAEGLREVAWHREIRRADGAPGPVQCDVYMVHCDCGRGRAWAERRGAPLVQGGDPRPMPMLLPQWLAARESDDPRGALYVDPANRERISVADRARIDAANQKPAVKVSGGFAATAPRQPPAEARKHYQDRDDEPDGWRGSCED